jgi:hypothetical protein
VTVSVSISEVSDDVDVRVVHHDVESPERVAGRRHGRRRAGNGSDRFGARDGLAARRFDLGNDPQA